MVSEYFFFFFQILFENFFFCRLVEIAFQYYNPEHFPQCEAKRQLERIIHRQNEKKKKN